MNLIRLALVGIVYALVLYAADPFEGAWQFNSRQSHCTETPTLAEENLEIREDGGKLIVTAERLERPPEARRRTQTWYLDEKPRKEQVAYRGPRNSTYDAISTKRASERTVEEIYRKGDRVVGSATFEVSPDGKTLTVDRKTTTDAGSEHKDHFVFDRRP